MDRSIGRRRNLLAPAAVALLLVASPPSSAATKKTTAKPTTRAIAECTAPVTRPKEIVLACADAGARLISARWTTWTSTRATGSGTYEYNDCEPYCAAGKIHRVKATFTLGGVVATKKYGRLFSKVMVRWSGTLQEYDLPTSVLSDVVMEPTTTTR